MRAVKNCAMPEIYNEKRKKKIMAAVKHYLLIAEKPDLMRKIEHCYKSNRDKIPYEIDFVSQRGHLVTLKYPDEIDESLKDWTWDTLPINPEEHGGWQYKIIKDKKTGNFLTSRERYDEIKAALKSGKYDGVINAGDPDQEGELLIRIVLKHMKNKLPIKRFWTNDLTEGRILDALLNLRDDDNDAALKNLLDAAYGRQHSDYRFGMNLSRAATLKMGTRVACGRVKTPILAIVCKRENEINNFRPETVYGVKASYEEGFDGTLISSGKQEEDYEEEDEPDDSMKGVVWFKDKREAQAVIDEINGKDAVVEEYKAKRQQTYAPKLFKLATAQVEAGKMGYSAADTLRIIQGLYEKKILSYPRTGCEYLGGDEDFEAMLNAAATVPELKEFVDRITDKDIERVKRTRTWVNSEALEEEGHSALVPTTAKPEWSEMEDEEKDIYSMICRQFVAPFLPPLIQDRAELTARCGKRLFKSTGKTLVDPGWTEVFGRKFSDTQIPAHKKGDMLDIKKLSISEKTSVCPKRYTTADLIAVCENPLKFLNDKSLKKLGKKLKIGTPATRANIIEELVRTDKYLKKIKEGRREVVVPTTTGKEIIDNIGDCDICKVDLTGEWEEKLEKVRSGKLSLTELEEGMKHHVARLVEDFKHRDMKPVTPVSDGYQQIGICPRCGGRLMQGPTRFYCSGYKDGCKAGGFRERNGVIISADEYLDMVRNGTELKKTAEKDGRTWEQKVKCDPETLRIIYPSDKKETPYTCPFCGGKIIESAKAYYCENSGDDDGCGFRISKSFSGKTIEKEEFVRLFTEGASGVIEGLYSKKTNKYFAAKMVADKEKNKIVLKFADTVVPTDYKCPICGKPLVEKGSRYVCTGMDDGTCGFQMYNTQAKKKIEDGMVKKMLAAVRNGDVSGGEQAYITKEPVSVQLGACPICGESLMRENLTFHCQNSESCRFSFYRIMAGHIVTDNEIRDVLRSGRTDVIGDFVSQKGSNFSARIIVDKDEEKLSFKFEDSATKSKYKCPICGDSMTENAAKLSCECGMQIWKKQAGTTLTEKDINDLIKKGETRQLKMKSKAGRDFKAKIVIDRENKKTTFDFS